MRRAFTQHSTFADIRTLGIFANTNEVVGLSVTRSRADEWTLIDIQVKFEAHFQQKSTFNDSRRHIGGSYCSKQNRIEGPQLVKYRIRQNFPVTQVPSTTEVKIGGIQTDPCGANHFQGLGDDFGSDPVSADHGDAMR